MSLSSSSVVKAVTSNPDNAWRLQNEPHPWEYCNAFKITALVLKQCRHAHLIPGVTLNIREMHAVSAYV